MSKGRDPESEPFGVTIGVLLPNGENKRYCLDLNSLVREELDRILKENKFPRDPSIHCMLLNNSDGSVTELDPRKPLGDYIHTLAVGADTTLEIRKRTS